jgi:hypothetical protein
LGIGGSPKDEGIMSCVLHSLDNNVKVNVPDRLDIDYRSMCELDLIATH